MEISSYDLRTRLGKEVIEKLKILEKVIYLIEGEQYKFGSFFPDSFRISRFNDALILGMDIESEFLPAIGHPNKGQMPSMDQIKSYIDKNKTTTNNPLNQHLDKLSYEVSQFIGVVSRIHNFINDEESKIHMPGCRPVISSGMRYKFIREKDNKEDYLLANFSFSNTYKINENGSKYGFGENKCYLESNLAQISGFNKFCKRAIGFTKFIYDETLVDPFDGKDNENKFKISVLKETTLFRKKYFFR